MSWLAIQAEVKSEDSLSADTCSVTHPAAAAVDDDDDDDSSQSSALVIDESATEQFALMDSGKMLCSTPAAAGHSALDDNVSAAKERQLWIVIKRHMPPTQITSGNSLLCP